MSAGPLEFMVKSDPRINMEMLIGRAATGEIHMHAFLALLEQFQMSFDDLYRLYVAKNVLNMFRQDHGYKQGTYVKTWMGEEDNVVLDNLLTARPNATPEMLEARLGQLYNKATAATA